MRLPEKHERNKSEFSKKSDLKKQDARDILRISQYSGIHCISDPHTGHNSVKRVADLSYLEKKTGVPKNRIRKLARENFLDERFGYSTTITAFIQIWLYFGADPFRGI